MTWMDEDGRVFRDDIPRDVVVVARMPNGHVNLSGIWIRRFLGVKVADNPNGTISVQIAGPAPNDFTQSVFYKGSYRKGLDRAK